MSIKTLKPITWPLSAALFLGVSSCGNMDDFDIDLRGGQYDTTEAAQNASRAKPIADERGVISYPTYQVVEALDGDTVGKIATRLNTAAGPIARIGRLLAAAARLYCWLCSFVHRACADAHPY